MPTSWRNELRLSSYKAITARRGDDGSRRRDPEAGVVYTRPLIPAPHIESKACAAVLCRRRSRIHELGAVSCEWPLPPCGIARGRSTSDTGMRERP